VSTGVEKRELKRVTPNMWTLLRYAERLDGQAEIGGLGCGPPTFLRVEVSARCVSWNSVGTQSR
jgi:hypothetical protein